MARRLMELPRAEPFPRNAVDAVPLPVMGWRHGELVYAYTTLAGPDGNFQAVILSIPARKPIRGWGCDTLDHAISIAAQEFSHVAYGTPIDATVYEGGVPPPSGLLN